MLRLKFFRDREIVNRIRSNDRTVLGELYTRYRKLIFSYITSHGGNEADAEDMLQEAIVVLWQNVNNGTFRLEAQLSTFLTAVAKNKWMAESRKRRRPEQGAADDPEPSALQQVLADETREQVQAALNEISETCRRLLLLFYFEERSMGDIARLMEFAGPDVAKSKKYQCKKALEKILRKKMSETEEKSS